jgi:hypothetical protein
MLVYSAHSIGMLSFALYNLLKHPEAMAKLRAEVDEVLGDHPLQVSDLGKLPYLTGTFKLAPVSLPNIQEFCAKPSV